MAHSRKKIRSRRPAPKSLYRDAPDLRETFEAVSAQMLAEFRRTRAATHPGGKGLLREQALGEFLRKHLPGRFGVGTGQFVHPSNLLSKQCDIVIHDRLNTPLLMPDASHALFPVEAVFAVVAVKSKLGTAELSDALTNVQSAFRVANDPSPYGPGGRWTGGRTAGPSCFIFSYACDRSLEAVAEQVRREWPENGGRVQQPPPLIVALGKGLVGPPYWLMTNTALADLVKVRETKELSLLGFFMHLLGEITSDARALPDFSFKSYLSMPAILDRRRVWQHFWMFDFEQVPQDRAIKGEAMNKIIAACAGQTMLRFADYFRDQLGRTSGTGREVADKRTYVFNPKGLKLDEGRGEVNPPRVPASVVAVDDVFYVIARDALAPEDFDAVRPEVVALFG